MIIPPNQSKIQISFHIHVDRLHHLSAAPYLFTSSNVLLKASYILPVQYRKYILSLCTVSIALDISLIKDTFVCITWFLHNTNIFIRKITKLFS